MTKQDLNNIALTDEELEAAAGGAFAGLIRRQMA